MLIIEIYINMDIYQIKFSNNSYPDSLSAYQAYRTILKKNKNNYKLFEIHYSNDPHNYNNNYMLFTRKLEKPSNIKSKIIKKGIEILYTDI
jgi:hypothetical protein